jgi:hypothetical protein
MAFAVLYRFEVWEDGERRLVNEEAVPASTRAMLEPQLTSVPQRPLLARGPGWLVFADYQSARRAAQVLDATADSVELREVESAAGEADAPWVAADGTRFALVPGGLAQRVK